MYSLILSPKAPGGRHYYHLFVWRRNWTQSNLLIFIRPISADNKIWGNATSYQRLHPYTAFRRYLECIYLTVDVFGLEAHEGNWSRGKCLEVQIGCKKASLEGWSGPAPPVWEIDFSPREKGDLSSKIPYFSLSEIQHFTCFMFLWKRDASYDRCLKKLVSCPTLESFVMGQSSSAHSATCPHSSDCQFSWMTYFGSTLQS